MSGWDAQWLFQRDGFPNTRKTYLLIFGHIQCVQFKCTIQSLQNVISCYDRMHTFFLHCLMRRVCTGWHILARVLPLYDFGYAGRSSVVTFEVKVTYRRTMICEQFPTRNICPPTISKRLILSK